MQSCFIRKESLLYSHNIVANEKKMEQTQQQKKHMVIVYSTPSCMYCKLAKEYFKEKGVVFSEYNVQADVPKREEMFKKSGQMGVPVIDIDGQLTVGFDKARIKSLLGIS